MSSGGLNGGVLSVSKLVVGGSTFTGGSGVSGLSTTPATSTTTANPVPFSATWDDTLAPGATPTAVFTATAGGMALDLATPPLGGGSGIPDLTTTPATAGTGAVSTAFSATIVDNLAPGATPTAVFTGSAGAMALAIATPPFGGGSGIPTLTTTPATAGTGAVSTAFTVGAITTTSSATTLAFTGSAGGMSLGGNIQVSPGGLPSIYYSAVKTWTTAGATDSITLPTVLPAGTYLPVVSWTTATAGLIVGALSAVVPIAGGGGSASPLQILCSGSVATTAGSDYAYILYKLT